MTEPKEEVTVSLKFPSQEAADVWMAWFSNSGEQGYFECEDYPLCRQRRYADNEITFHSVIYHYMNEFS